MFDFLGLGKKKEEGGGAPKPAITIGAPAAPAAPAPTPTGGALVTSEGREVTAVVEDLQKDVERLKDSMNVLKENMKNLDKKLEEIQKTIGQLASIYEIVMNQLNPFLDEDEKPLPVRKKVKVAPEEKSTTQSVSQASQVASATTAGTPQPASTAEVSADVVLPHVDLTNPKVIEILIDWAKFLVEKVGHENIDELLQYYVDIRWISEEVKEVVKRYAEGIRVDIEPDVVGIQLDPEDHSKSLEYILAIKDVMSR